MLLGTGIVLARLRDLGLLTRPVRLIFQPAEELVPGGAPLVIDAGGLDNVAEIYALHCDPTLEVGRIGFKAGPITSAADMVSISLRHSPDSMRDGRGKSHLISAWPLLSDALQAAVARCLDPRSGLSLMWGSLRGQDNGAPNSVVQATGTVRCLDEEAWTLAPKIISDTVAAMSKPLEAEISIEYTRGVPPVINSPTETNRARALWERIAGEAAAAHTSQSLAGEDFAWYLRTVPGSLFRLGVKSKGAENVLDLHRGDFDVDENAIRIGVRFFTSVILAT
jgi:amidohydrolase